MIRTNSGQKNMAQNTVLLEDLIGRQLNDVEAKNNPGKVFYKGAMEIPLIGPKVSIIGSRNASAQGMLEAQKVSKILVKENITIVSGLAKGIDTVGHETAIMYNGKTVAVIGTPLNVTYPQENSELQKKIMREHLVISQYPVGYPISRKNFVLRNRTMALISDATVIVEAGDSSGSLHQGWEALRLGRPLFLCRPVAENSNLKWPEKMMDYGAMILDRPEDILEYLPPRIDISELLLVNCNEHDQS